MAPGSGFHHADESDDASRNPILITDAAQSFEEQQRVRIRKYTILMAIRIPALVLAAIAYGEWHNALISLAIIGASIPLPWIAVLVANDRPPRRPDEPRRYDHKPPPRPAIESPGQHTIEG
ncbi:DUF3099 domain-containing protein [Rhodococcus spelaei]|uniref:DUF3099 domain-containing protein n=1 Tax=Rhodococcus spelaei TaxID=2546320 RepID=A0A541B1T3_9NOCA|nr:DUF3099 domain-containing protein [Rhodococcus spelaei]TQF66274.1 DUF3099 domain-containing protein [Rhodococcus spelaei]